MILASKHLTLAAMMLFMAKVSVDFKEELSGKRFLQKLKSLNSTAGCIYTAFLHDGITKPAMEVVRTATASAGKCLLVAEGGIVGVLGIEKLSILFGYPNDLLNEVSTFSEKMLHLGNSISLDLLLFLFNRMEECLGNECTEAELVDMLKSRAVSNPRSQGLMAFFETSYHEERRRAKRISMNGTNRNRKITPREAKSCHSNLQGFDLIRHAALGRSSF